MPTKVGRDGESRKLAGSEFQIFGAEIRKAREPNSRFIFNICRHQRWHCSYRQRGRPLLANRRLLLLFHASVAVCQYTSI